MGDILGVGLTHYPSLIAPDEERAFPLTRMQRGAAGLSVAVTEARLRTATSMERNLREGRLKVGMVVCHKTPK